MAEYPWIRTYNWIQLGACLKETNLRMAMSYGNFSMVLRAVRSMGSHGFTFPFFSKLCGSSENEHGTYGTQTCINLPYLAITSNRKLIFPAFWGFHGFQSPAPFCGSNSAHRPMRRAAQIAGTWGASSNASHGGAASAGAPKDLQGLGGMGLNLLGTSGCFWKFGKPQRAMAPSGNHL